MCSSLSRLILCRKVTSGIDMPRCILQASSKSLLKVFKNQMNTLYLFNKVLLKQHILYMNHMITYFIYLPENVLLICYDLYLLLYRLIESLAIRQSVKYLLKFLPMSFDKSTLIL